MKKQILLTVLSGLLVFASLPPPLSAAIVSTQDVIAADTRDLRVSALQSRLAAEDVRAALIELGVDPRQAQARVASLTDAELTQLENEIDALPAGGGTLALIGAVFVVLLILELTGVTNIFNNP